MSKEPTIPDKEIRKRNTLTTAHHEIHHDAMTQIKALRITTNLQSVK